MSLGIVGGDTLGYVESGLSAGFLCIIAGVSLEGNNEKAHGMTASKQLVHKVLELRDSINL